MNGHGLNERQLRFADYYIETGNASEAYRRAGYKSDKESVVSATSSQLLANPKVRAYIDSRLSKAHSKRVMEADEVMERLTAIARGEATGKTLRGVGMGEQIISDINPSIGEQHNALVQIGKRYGMWVDRQDINANVGVTIVDDVEDDE